jgi:outer membrane lipoprotein-sorting protein
VVPSGADSGHSTEGEAGQQKGGAMSVICYFRDNKIRVCDGVRVVAYDEAGDVVVTFKDGASQTIPSLRLAKVELVNL